MIRTRSFSTRTVNRIRNGVINTTSRCLYRRLAYCARFGLHPVRYQRPGTRRSMPISRRRYHSRMSLLVFMFLFLAEQERHLECAGCAALVQVRQMWFNPGTATAGVWSSDYRPSVRMKASLRYSDSVVSITSSRTIFVKVVGSQGAAGTLESTQLMRLSSEKEGALLLSVKIAQRYVWRK